MPPKLHFLIAHGTGGSPAGNWFPWLKKALEEEGHTVSAPPFPTPENQSLTNWIKVAKEALNGHEPSNIVLVGHSTGSILVLRLAELTDKPYRAIFSICPFAQDLGNADFDPLNSTFVQKPFDWGRVSQGAELITCFAGDNDPYVPLHMTQEVAAGAKAKLYVIPNGGHLNAETSYFEFPALLQEIRNVIAS